MLIGVPSQEYRVGLTPASVRELSAHGHRIVVEHAAGAVARASGPAHEAGMP